MLLRFYIVVTIVGLTAGFALAAQVKKSKSPPKAARSKQTRREDQIAPQVEPVGPGLFLLRDPLVQAELKLTDRQKADAEALAAEFNESVYLIDRRGFVRYWWYGELNWDGAEGEKYMRRRIAELIAEK